jgi:hypothetical protein
MDRATREVLKARRVAGIVGEELEGMINEGLLRARVGYRVANGCI